MNKRRRFKIERHQCDLFGPQEAASLPNWQPVPVPKPPAQITSPEPPRVPGTLVLWCSWCGGSGNEANAHSNGDIDLIPCCACAGSRHPSGICHKPGRLRPDPQGHQWVFPGPYNSICLRCGLSASTIQPQEN